jgi:MFS family permease
MREAAPASRPFLFSAAYTVLFLSAIVGSLVGGILPHAFRWIVESDRLALRFSLFTACGLYALSTIPFSGMKARPPVADPAAPLRWSARERALAAVRELAMVDWGLHAKLVVPSLLIGLGAGLIIPFLNLYFRDRFGLDEAAIGLLFAAMQGFMVVSNVFGPTVSKRMGLVRGVVVTQLVSVPFMVILALSHSYPFVVGAFFLRSAMMNMNQPLASHFAMEVVPERDHAITNSLLSLAWFLAWSVSADIGGAMIERVGYTQPLLLAAGLYVLASLLYWLFFRNVEEGRLPRSEVEIPDA